MTEYYDTPDNGEAFDDELYENLMEDFTDASKRITFTIQEAMETVKKINDGKPIEESDLKEFLDYHVSEGNLQKILAVNKYRFSLESII